MNLQLALRAALEASAESRKILKSYFGRVLSVDEKPGAGLVSEADRESERIIQSVLSRHLPEAGFLGEEAGFDKKSTTGLTWVVDPLDGTHNFVSGFPIYCSSIALVRDGEPVVGVIDAPDLGLTFHACRGQGAFLNERPIRVTNKPMKHALLCTGFSYHQGKTLDDQVEIFRRFMHRSLGVRRPGAAALDLAWVANGAFGGFWERGLQPWDMAAGIVLVEEAGGLTSDYKGAKLELDSDTVLVGAPHLHREMLEIMNLAPSNQ
ncbi:MAG TPA: inositol monophosphatase family protein [Bdellovibrionales bacterium]|nr:inositol monophosphatase family protein [Bdellovibrionales bacterium]